MNYNQRRVSGYYFAGVGPVHGECARVAPQHLVGHEREATIYRNGTAADISWPRGGRCALCGDSDWLPMAQGLRSAIERNLGPRSNPAPKNIDHKFAGSLFSVDPTLAMGYLRGSMSKGTARDLAKAKLSKAKAKRRSNPAALDRCVESVQRRGSAVNAWAVCTASLKRTGRLAKRRSNPDWAALSAKAREKAKAAYARAKPHAVRGLAATKAGAARAGAAIKRGTKKAAPHVARGIRSLSERLDRYAVSNPRTRTSNRR
jgi:hypothetical protein